MESVSRSDGLDNVEKGDTKQSFWAVGENGLAVIYGKLGRWWILMGQ